jgi:SAM-dependent methyltransferase
MANAEQHYADLLAEQYTWMLGGDMNPVADGQAELLRNLGLRPGPLAVDLGAGSGAQSLALQRLGFGSVLAVDTSKALLDELLAYAGPGSPIRTVHADIRTALPEVTEPGTVNTIVCMGDTLPHLPQLSDVVALLENIADALVDGGELVITYRDLTVELEGTARFLPVRTTEDRILTCFLEYVSEETVMVHDLLHVREDGEWSLRTGSYPKLRIGGGWLADQCRTAGLTVRHDAVGPRGMRVLHAQKAMS